MSVYDLDRYLPDYVRDDLSFTETVLEPIGWEAQIATPFTTPGEFYEIYGWIKWQVELDATPGNRNVQLRITDPVGGNALTLAAPAVQAPGTIIDYLASTSYSSFVNLGQLQILALPPIIFSPGMSWTVVVGNVNPGGDFISQPAWTRTRFPTGPTRPPRLAEIPLLSSAAIQNARTPGNSG